VDIAAKGIGLNAATYLEVGDQAEVHYHAEDFEGIFEVECRYCHATEGGRAHLGLKIVSTDRCQMARWQCHIEAVQAELMQQSRQVA
jgi:hypothetical protein